MRNIVIVAGLARSLVLSGAAVAQASPGSPPPDWSTKSPLCQASHESLANSIVAIPDQLFPLRIVPTMLLNAICA
ncbi:hypothetical protein [Nocardia colli]|uniref:hypothetical protein n=1 Tax=Nocardia colli TaxID=2545717 RepID=UPI0035E147F3